MLAVNVGVAVHTNLITELSAEKLIERHAVCLAGKIPQSDLETRYAAALTGVSAELLDASEKLIDVAGVFSDKTGL